MSPRCAWVALGLVAASGAWAQTPKTYEPPRLADGHPDFQGVWGTFPTATRLEPNPAFGDRLVVSQAEARALADASLAKVRGNPALALQADLPDQQDLVVVRGEHRTRLIVEPADGKIPFTAAARQAAGVWSANFSRVKAGLVTEGPESLALADRCISLGGQPPMGLSMATQIVQNAGYVLIYQEGYNESRIVRIARAPELGAIRTRLGASVGRWDRDVLVVETSAFRLDEPFYVSIGPNQNPPFRIGPDSKVIERFTRVSADELDYTFTIEDPAIYAGPWLGEYSLVRTVDQRVWESACHEGNYAINLTLEGGRKAEAGAAAAKAAAGPGSKVSAARH